MPTEKPLRDASVFDSRLAARAGIEGESPGIERLRDSIRKMAPYPTTVLIRGETGTGKGAVARALHELGPRRSEPFVHVDCAGLVEGLLEAELYGVAQGGYTGASRSRAGRFETAGSGTLFLDEIGELSRAGQVKLLRVLEEGRFERVGETKTRRLRARIVAATHVDLALAVTEARFRADLFYRLRVLELIVPPLRDRREDLGDWVERAAQRAASRLGCSRPRFTQSAIERMKVHSWPGNLRELFHVVEAAAVLSSSNDVELDLMDRLLVQYGSMSPETRPKEPRCGVRATLDAELALDRARGNVSLAARRLGVPRSTLRYRLGLDDAITRAKRLREGRSIRDESPPQ